MHTAKKGARQRHWTRVHLDGRANDTVTPGLYRVFVHDKEYLFFVVYLHTVKNNVSFILPFSNFEDQCPFLWHILYNVSIFGTYMYPGMGNNGVKLSFHIISINIIFKKYDVKWHPSYFQTN